MSKVQPGILADETQLARYLVFPLKPASDPMAALQKLGSRIDGDRTVIGLGQSLLLALGKQIEGLKTFPVMAGPGFSIPATPATLSMWLRGDDRGELLHRTRELAQTLSDAFELERRLMRSNTAATVT